MTRRETILAALNREPLERTPISVWIELWYANAISKDALPQGIRGMSREEVEDYLGFCRAATYRTRPRLRFRTLEVKQKRRLSRDISSGVSPWSGGPIAWVG